MKCTNHPEVEAVDVCAECGKTLCGACVMRVGNSAWCGDCLERVVQRSRERPRGWTWRKTVAVCLSLIPGAGHMFLGLLGKGFALMGVLFASVFLVILYGDSTGMYWLIAYLVPTVSVLFLCYAIFDAMAVADAQRSGRSPSAAGDDSLRAVWERVLVSKRTIGWIILIAGIVGAISIFRAPLAELTRTYLAVEVPIGGLVLPVVLLIIGVTLLLRSRKPR